MTNKLVVRPRVQILIVALAMCDGYTEKQKSRFAKRSKGIQDLKRHVRGHFCKEKLQSGELSSLHV